MRNRGGMLAGASVSKRGSSNASCCRFALQGNVQLPAQLRHNVQARATGLCAMHRFLITGNSCSSRFEMDNNCPDMSRKTVPVALLMRLKEPLVHSARSPQSIADKQQSRLWWIVEIAFIKRHANEPVTSQPRNVEASLICGWPMR